jgi:hypothetical protein
MGVHYCNLIKPIILVALYSQVTLRFDGAVFHQQENQTAML